eukprot:1658984-Rhodomonas_salina.1
MEDSSTDSSGDRVRWTKPAQPSRRRVVSSSSSSDVLALDSDGDVDSLGQESSDLQQDATRTSRGTRRVHRLQARVKQLENAMLEAGLQVPPPAAAVEAPVAQQSSDEMPSGDNLGKKRSKSAKQRLAAKRRDRAALGGLGGHGKRMQREEIRQRLVQRAELRRAHGVQDVFPSWGSGVRRDQFNRETVYGGLLRFNWDQITAARAVMKHGTRAGAILSRALLKAYWSRWKVTFRMGGSSHVDFEKRVHAMNKELYQVRARAIQEALRSVSLATRQCSNWREVQSLILQKVSCLGIAGAAVPVATQFEKTVEISAVALTQRPHRGRLNKIVNMQQHEVIRVFGQHMQDILWHIEQPIRARGYDSLLRTIAMAG